MLTVMWSEYQWKCEAEMPIEYRFGRIRVSCEGYASSSDEYVLEGSCGLEYELEFTEPGRTGSYLGGMESFAG